MKQIVIALAAFAWAASGFAYGQDRSPDRSQPDRPRAEQSDKALSSTSVGGSGAAGQPTDTGSKADSGVSNPQTLGSQSR